VRRRICVVTGTRAEYGLLRWVMEGIQDREGLELKVVATGAHLSPQFGLTYREIESDGFVIDRRVEMLLNSDSPTGVTKSIGLGLVGFADVLRELQPDLMVLLGDRFEVFAAAAAAMVACVPIAHLSGGESTEGAFDEAIRHSISKMSHLHFVAAEEYRRRVIQLGEHPDRVFNVGGLGVEAILRLDLLDREELERSLRFELAPRNLLITFHPVTLEVGTASRQMGELLAALETLTGTHLIFTMPNADTGGRELFELVQRFVDSHPQARAYTSLGQLRYLSCIKHVDGVVGNSSSGLAEVPSFKKGTVNIGDRQSGRLKAASVIDCDPNKNAIVRALDRLFSADFRDALEATVNPYGEGRASERIVDVLHDYPLESILKKSFHDLEY
jgi:GDP/UDP-N,N'-diacetylbacillosamine 2-epimerase (hydrolysing)